MERLELTRHLPTVARIRQSFRWLLRIVNQEGHKGTRRKAIGTTSLCDTSCPLWLMHFSVRALPASCKRHSHPVPGAQGNAGKRGYRVPGNEAQSKSPRNGRQEKVGFHHGERRADAEPRAASKGEVGELGEALDGVGGPPVRIELFGLLKETRVAMQDPWAHDNIRSHRQSVAVDFYL